MEKSFLNFTMNHPEWVEGDRRATQLLHKIQRCASTPQNELVDCEVNGHPTSIGSRSDRTPADSALGLSFERLDRYAMTMQEGHAR